MRCDVIAEGVVAAAREVSLQVPLVVRLEGTNVELGKKILRESGLPITVGRQSGRRRREDRQGGQGGRLMAVLVDTQHQGHLPGLHRRAGHLPFRAGDRLRHQDGRRRDPGKGGTTHLDLPVFDTVAEAVRSDRRRRDASSTCRRPSPPTRSSRRSTPGCRWSSASPRASRCSTWCGSSARSRGAETRLIGPELPGRHHARRVQDRHHARPHPQPRARSASSRAPAR